MITPSSLCCYKKQSKETTYWKPLCFYVYSYALRLDWTRPS